MYLRWTNKFWQENLQPSLSECIADSFPVEINKSETNLKFVF